MKVQLFALMLAVAAPLSAQAGDNRSSIEFGYSVVGTPLTDLYSTVVHDYEGISLNGTWAFSEKWSASLGYAQGGSGVDALDMDSQWTLGLGYHHPISEKADLVVKGIYRDVNEDLGPNSIDSQVWGAEIGVAGRGEKLSGGIAAGYESWDADIASNVLNDDQAYVRFNGGYYFTDNWSMQLEYKLGFGDSNSAFLGARYSF